MLHSWVARPDHHLNGLDLAVGHLGLILVPFQVFAHAQAEHLSELDLGCYFNVDVHAFKKGNGLRCIFVLQDVPAPRR